MECEMKLPLRDPKEREIVLAILEYLQAKYPGWCFVRVEPVTAMRMALKVKGVMHGGAWKDGAWADGVADILGIGQCPCLAARIVQLPVHRERVGERLEARMQRFDRNV